ncbi:MAG: TlyA family RNA methyltransferase [Oscillospiraceae bacterium]|jgi:23S rRNA (cytidine1920-2'-O)/16S rRNA (cytidine1409-2'-O)-methyltransferase|nr:TlyA family RNA methyltransferase [Oscillospiraceae bacterium]
MKKRLDIMIFEKGFENSREKVRSLIMQGCVYIDNQKCDKPGMLYNEDCVIEVRSNKQKYVSRGGLKLEKAIKSFNIDLKDKIAVDVGASTGGFTDCMLQNGCKKVYSVDVGYGQLDWNLRNDERVINLERTNARYIDENVINDKVDFFSVDVSFISLKLILPTIKKISSRDSCGICLIKPQFEAGKGKVGKNGVVRDKSIHIEVINKVLGYSTENNFYLLGLDYSPIKGPKGNIEYLLYLSSKEHSDTTSCIDIKKVVENSHLRLISLKNV